MVTSASKYRVAHLLVRLIVTINVADLLLSFYPPYFQIEKQFFTDGGDLRWLMISSILLPVYVGFLVWWMSGRKPSQTKALFIDGAFAVAWFVIWWGFVLHSIWRYAGSL